MLQPVLIAALLGATTMIPAGPPVGAAPAGAPSATGHGTMSFGKDGDGRGYMRFTVTGGDQPSVSLLFAGEHHDHEMTMMFPDVVVTLGSSTEVTFSGSTVELTGNGQLHDDLVTVSVSATDKGRKGADTFDIECHDADGTEVFHAHGELFRGDIVVKSGGSEQGGRP